MSACIREKEGKICGRHRLVVMLVVFSLLLVLCWKTLSPLPIQLSLNSSLRPLILPGKIFLIFLSTAAVWVCVGCPYLLLFIAGMVLHLSDKENEEAKANPAKQRPDDVDFNAGDVESQTPE